ncbi:hypothetical protein SDC9_132575 [bioreactor metagenome]|uniref:CRISPR system Cascade subunit CasD n=1 Tax=bioreactor metagenome TaxID=1076179 RepID=A0A645D819_9ZZZZ
MSSNQAFLALFFDAPLLSFGVGSKFDRRETLGFPSRGAVTGLVAAALGMARDDCAGLARLAQLKMTGIAFPSAPGSLLGDYHTVGGGYSPDELRSIVATADGGRGGTVVTDRYYLADGKFAAVLSGEPGFLNEIGTALLNPVWGGWIGRKNCLPATPVFQGVFDSEAAALAKLKTLLKAEDGNAACRLWDECPLEAPDAVSYPDIPVDWARRTFHPRAVRER